MFADSLLDAPGWDNHSRRGWTTLISFALEALAVGALLIAPLLYTQGLPQMLSRTPLVMQTLAPPSPAPANARTARPSQSNLAAGRLQAPPQVPRQTLQIDDRGVPPVPNIPQSVGVRGGTGDPWARGGVPGSIGVSEVAPPPKPAPSHPLIVSRMMEGNLIQRVQPEYPPLARQAGIQGAVVLRAVISRAGAIENLQVLSGHPMLAPAAIAAVRQWRYRPYVLDGEPVDVETQITVNFILSGR